MMKFFIVSIRFPFGIIASIFLIAWTFYVGIFFNVRFAYYAVLGNKRSIANSLIPSFQVNEGTHFLPDVWEWVFDPEKGKDFNDIEN